MKRSTLRATAASLLCIGLLAASTAAFAQQTVPKTPQETRSQPTPDDRSAASTESLMKWCVKRERASDNTKSESEAKQICQDAMRAQRENRDNEPQPPHHP